MNNNHKTQSNASPRIKVFLALTILIVIFILGWLFVLPRLTGRVVIEDQVAIRDDLRQVLLSLNLPGTIAYDQLKDQGCDDSHSVGLQTRMSCGFNGSKLAKNNGDLAKDLHQTDATLSTLGFHRFLLNGQTDTGFTEALKGTSDNFVLVYARNEVVETHVQLSYYRDATRANDFEIQSLLRAGKFQAPSPGEYIYGVTISASYYSCEPLFFEPCLFQPDPLK